MIEDMEVALADPDLDWRQRSRYNRDIAMLLHQVDEEKCELPPRTSRVEVTTSTAHRTSTSSLWTRTGDFHGAEC